MRCFTIGFFLQKVTVYLLHSRTNASLFFYNNINFNFVDYSEDSLEYVRESRSSRIFLRQDTLQFNRELKVFYKFSKNRRRILSKVFFFIYTFLKICFFLLI